MSSSPDALSGWTPPAIPEARAAVRNRPGGERTETVETAASAYAPWSPAALGPETAPRAASPSREGAVRWEAPVLPDAPAARAAEPAPSAEEGEDYVRGFADGARQGRAQAEAEILPAAHALGQVGQSLAASRGRILHDLEANLIALSLGVARKIIQREATTDPALVRDLVVRALEALRPDSPVAVHLHPEDLESARRQMSPVLQAGGDEIQWVGDPALGRGDFLVEGAQRLVDGRVDEALKNLYERLTHD